MSADVDTAALGRLSLRTWTGEPVLVSAAWAERPAVMVWLRHFG
jgi:hypothetical protein